MIRKTKTVVVLVAFVIAGLLLIERPRAGAQEQTNKLEIIGVQVPYEQRMGVDDGALFAIHFGGDTHGSLDACG
jgi:hypothetical protein